MIPEFHECCMMHASLPPDPMKSMKPKHRAFLEAFLAVMSMNALPEALAEKDSPNLTVGKIHQAGNSMAGQLSIQDAATHPSQHPEVS